MVPCLYPMVIPRGYTPGFFTGDRGFHRGYHMVPCLYPMVIPHGYTPWFYPVDVWGSWVADHVIDEVVSRGRFSQGILSGRKFLTDFLTGVIVYFIVGCSMRLMRHVCITICITMCCVLLLVSMNRRVCSLWKAMNRSGRILSCLITWAKCSMGWQKPGDMHLAIIKTMGFTTRFRCNYWEIICDWLWSICLLLMVNEHMCVYHYVF